MVKWDWIIRSVKKQPWVFVLNGFYNPNSWESKTNTFINEPDGKLRSQTKSITSKESKWKNFSTNFNLRHVFDSTGQELATDLDYVQYSSTSKQPLYSSYFDKLGNAFQPSDTLLGDLPQNIKIISGKMDYTKPLKNGAKFEAGLKASYVKTDNNAIYENWINNKAVLDSSRSNHFIYDENIFAAYVNYSRN